MSGVSIWRRLALWRSLETSPAAAAPAAGPLREAIDGDDDQWRRLSEDPKRDLSAFDLSRMRDVATYLWRANPIGNRMIELPLAYILGEGVSISSPDEGDQAALERFWADPINAMAIRLPQMFRELAMYGEQALPVFTGPDGGVRLGWLDPSRIDHVVWDPDNARVPIGLVEVQDAAGRQRRWRIVHGGEDADLFTNATQAIRAGFSDGEVLWWRINTLQRGRGHSDLLAGGDWIDGYEQWLFGELEGGAFRRAWCWDIELKGASQAEIDAYRAKLTPPAPGSAFVHNEAVAMDTRSPSLQAADASEFGRLMRNHALGAATIPEHWFGGGGEVNRATAAEMGEPVFKSFAFRQSEYRELLADLGRLVIRRARAAGRLSPGASAQGSAAPIEVRVDFPEMVSRDVGRLAGALAQAAAGTAAAVADGLMTRATAVRLLQQIAARLGVDYDAEDELTAASAERDAEQDRLDPYDLPDANGRPGAKNPSGDGAADDQP